MKEFTAVITRRSPGPLASEMKAVGVTEAGAALMGPTASGGELRSDAQPRFRPAPSMLLRARGCEERRCGKRSRLVSQKKSGRGVCRLRAAHPAELRGGSVGR